MHKWDLTRRRTAAVLRSVTERIYRGWSEPSEAGAIRDVALISMGSSMGPYRVFHTGHTTKLACSLALMADSADHLHSCEQQTSGYARIVQRSGAGTWLHRHWFNSLTIWTARHLRMFRPSCSASTG